jgi:hypothetical protein
MKKKTAVDKLLRHLEVCVQCRAAKVSPTVRRCPTGQGLLRATLSERHPDTERNTR